MKPDFTDITQVIDRHLPNASADEAKAAGVRVWQRLRIPGDSVGELDARLDQAQPAAQSRWRGMGLAAAAVLVMATSIGTAMLWRPTDDVLFRVVEGDVRKGETLRSNGGAGAVLALSDGSRIEMRSHSDLSLERAGDGLRIRLNSGGIIVNAAKQRTGHLYVQTKDMIVSVVGTVFLVNADEQGSRVAVIEGEVRVQQGTTEQKLRPGQQVTTNPNMEPQSVAIELMWSRRAEAHLALLRQAANALKQQPATPASQTPKEPRVAFEVISIRPSASAPAPAAGARGGGGGLNSRPSKEGCAFDSLGYSYQLDPGRFAVTRATLLHLAAYTIPNPKAGQQRRYDINCGVLTRTGLLSGGPDWIRTEMWDIVASIREGVFTSSPRLIDPIVQQMLRTMVAERFNLVMRRESREVPVYLLKIGKDGPKFNGVSPFATNRDPQRGPVFMFLGPDGKPTPAADLPPSADVGGFTVIARPGGSLSMARNVSMTEWANQIFGLDGRPVLDRTGLTGRYDFHYEESGRPLELLSGSDAGAVLTRTIVKTMGFELEEARAPLDAWVIERAEKPTEN